MDNQQPNPEQSASDVEQSQYNAMMYAIGIAMYSDDAYKPLVEALKAGEPAKTVGSITATLINSARQQAFRGGRRISEDVLQEVGKDTVTRLLEIAATEGVIQLQNEEERDKLVTQAEQEALSEYVSMNQRGEQQGPQQPPQAQQPLLAQPGQPPQQPQPGQPPPQGQPPGLLQRA